MKLVVPPLDVAENEGFQKDILRREAFGESLKNLVIRSDDELVISLDGKWGEGKSTFVKMWQGLLTAHNVPNIYIDSFANDYVEDAFISVASAITSYVELNAINSNSEKIADYKDKAKNVGVKLLSWGTKVGVKALTLGAIKDSDIEALQDIKDDISASGSASISAFVEEKLSSHRADIDLFESFRNLLSDLPDEIKGNDGNPLVIIIDELDRCKPTYAVELIEKVKHLFSVKNVVFVLVMHRQQLECSVKSIYGSEIDAHTYLQKFINVETSLPKVTGSKSSSDLDNYCERLFDLHNLTTWGDDKQLQESIICLAKHYNLSLRQIERVYTNVAIFYASISDRNLRLVPVVSLLSVIKVTHPNIYSRLANSDITYGDLVSSLSLLESNLENEVTRKIEFMLSWFKFALISDKELSAIDKSERIHNYQSHLWDYNIARDRLIPLFIDKLNIFSVV
ncbi:KAP family P-loop NTPase fold protein [Vibrio anguillarum]|uniref:KAP family P-loop NTPase fold protein n=4 Tax=Vibrio anguillarum TaxID=55601 RepID=UPI0018FED088|nr:P-loop NTPase fold protein [Vibrio anguillarum]